MQTPCTHVRCPPRRFATSRLHVDCLLLLGVLLIFGCGDVHSDHVDLAASDGGARADAGTSSDSSVTEAECQKTTLVISASGTVTTPDTSPFSPTLAASPSGDTFLGAWRDTTGAIWASVLGPITKGVVASTATQVATGSSCNPVAAWTGNGFAVAWGNGANLMLQQLDSKGMAVGPSMRVASRPTAACADGLVAVGRELVFEWTEGPQIQEGGAGQWSEYAELLGPSGLDQSPVLINSLGAGSVSSLAVLAGVPYAAYMQIQPDNTSVVSVSAITWSSPLAATSLGQGDVQAFFSAGPQRVATLVSKGSAMTLYEIGVNGVQSIAEVNGNFAASADACGRIVGLASNGRTAGTAGAVGPIFAETIGGPLSQVTVTADFNEIVLLGAGSKFGVLWVEGGSAIGPSLGPMTLRFATITWQ